LKILVINGPNINMLGIREPEVYGNKTYADLLEFIKNISEELNIEVECVQSNHEGVIIDTIQNALGKYDGIVINPAAFTHTSIAILDALKSVSLPAIEVHLTNINDRESFRHHSYTSLACEKVFSGKGFDSYKEAIHFLQD